jgi:hypothetical protein
MTKEEMALKIHAFTSRFVPINIVMNVIDAIYDSGMYVVSPKPENAPPLPNIPPDCTDKECQALSHLLPGDCARCVSRGPKETT